MSEHEVLLIIKHNLKDFILKNNYKQNILCDVLNLSKSAISELLNGDRNIDVLEYKKICDYFNLSLDYFMPKPNVEGAEHDESAV